MTVLASFPRRVYQPGAYASPDRVLDNALNSVVFTINRFSWPDTGADVVALRVAVSYDGGVTWPAEFKITARGGDIVYKGQVAPASILTVELKPGTNRVMRAAVDIFTALDASATVEGF